MRYIGTSQYRPISNTDGVDCNEFLSDSGIGNHRVGMLWLVHKYLDASFELQKPPCMHTMAKKWFSLSINNFSNELTNYQSTTAKS